MATTATEDLRAKSVDDLYRLNQEVMADRADAESGYQARQAEINSEINRRLVTEDMEKYLGGLTPDVRREVLAGLARAKES